MKASLHNTPGRPPAAFTVTRLVNLTGHVIRVFGEYQTISIPSSGILIRVEEERLKVDRIRVGEDLIDITESQFGDVYDLPDSEPGVLYIVSRLVAAAIPERRDLIFPDQAVKKTVNGSTVFAGCRSFSRMTAPSL